MHYTGATACSTWWSTAGTFHCSHPVVLAWSDPCAQRRRIAAARKRKPGRPEISFLLHACSPNDISTPSGGWPRNYKTVLLCYAATWQQHGQRQGWIHDLERWARPGDGSPRLGSGVNPRIMYIMITWTMTVILNDDNTGCHIFMATAAYRATGINTFYSWLKVTSHNTATEFSIACSCKFAQL